MVGCEVRHPTPINTVHCFTSEQTESYVTAGLMNEVGDPYFVGDVF